MARESGFSIPRRLALTVSLGLMLLAYFMGMVRWIALADAPQTGPAVHNLFFVLTGYFGLVTLLIFFWKRWWGGLILCIIVMVFAAALTQLGLMFYAVRAAI